MKKILTVALLSFCVSGLSAQRPFIGANLWNGDITQLDTLQAIGVTNLRVKATDGENLHPLLSELERRNMQAVLFLTNAWEWSTGYEQYYSRATGEKPLLPSEVGYPCYMEQAGRFLSNKKAVALFDRYVKKTVRQYRRYRSVYAWEICNEPRAFGQDPDVLVAFIGHEAGLIKRLDAHRLVTTGSEGIWGCDGDSVLCRRLHEIPEIDYMTCHIWPYNWGWLNPASDAGQPVPDWQTNVMQYIRSHEEIAQRIGKPFVIEEFGFPRDHFDVNPAPYTSAPLPPTTRRDEMYRLVFRSLQSMPHLIGANFWCWNQDPPQEPQGLNAVFPSDTTTLNVIHQIF